MSKNEQAGLCDLDFDDWKALAEKDSESFEVARSAAIEALIESFEPERRERMRRLQWRIDQERRLAKSPMGACMRLSKMMWRQLLGDGGLRERLLALTGDLGRDEKIETTAPAGAQVLAFSRIAD